MALMQATSPAVIARNHAVEAALAAAGAGDMAPVRQLLSALARPFDHAHADPALALPPPASAVPYRTFCGT
jgi:uncharacterized protein YdiU (UPF0061 family)